MVDITVTLPGFVDANGNINLHGRDSLQIPLTYTIDGVEIDITVKSLWFEVAQALRIETVIDPANPLGRRILLGDADVRKIPNEGGLFVLRDETDPPVSGEPISGIVRWAGTITRGGFLE